MEVVDRMLELAEVRETDIVYDLGSGDGRIVIRAAKRFGARGVGVEIDPDLVDRSRQKASKEGVSHLVEFLERDALTVDVSAATVVTLYMLPDFIDKLRPILKRDLKPGARVVSHDYDIEGWHTTHVENISGGFWHQHKVFLYRIE
jgi:cyclopropane fatty-acyl-phospholipid synthase-like methyltransferase